MKFGYFTLTDNPPGYGQRRRNPNQWLLEVLEEAILAEELGFNSAWVPEHHFGLFGCLPTPAVFLAYLAAKTKRIMLAPATVLLPCNQPLRVAEEYAMLDLLSNGRAVFSAGRGYDQREYDAFAIPFHESRERFDKVEEAGIEEVILYFNFGGYSHPDTIRMMERFASEVMPHFATEAAVARV